MNRPFCVKSLTFKMKSEFTSRNTYITCGYIEKDGKKIPYELFINSKDLTTLTQYTLISRLISAIFRISPDATFLLEELSGISDPAGGRIKEGKTYMSIYDEIAIVIKRFFKTINYNENENES